MPTVSSEHSLRSNAKVKGWMMNLDSSVGHFEQLIKVLITIKNSVLSCLTQRVKSATE